MRKFIAWVLGWKVVALLDIDGEVTFRLARPTPYGLVCFRMSRVFQIGRCLLCDDGRVHGAPYVKEWREA